MRLSEEICYHVDYLKRYVTFHLLVVYPSYITNCFVKYIYTKLLKEYTNPRLAKPCFNNWALFIYHGATELTGIGVFSLFWVVFIVGGGFIISSSSNSSSRSSSSSSSSSSSNLKLYDFEQNVMPKMREETRRFHFMRYISLYAPLTHKIVHIKVFVTPVVQ